MWIPGEVSGEGAPEGVDRRLSCMKLRAILVGLPAVCSEMCGFCRECVGDCRRGWSRSELSSTTNRDFISRVVARQNCHLYLGEVAILLFMSRLLAVALQIVSIAEISDRKPCRRDADNSSERFDKIDEMHQIGLDNESFYLRDNA
jgi:hypothetical protein